MKPTDDLPRIIRQLRVPASAELDERIHAEIDRTTAQRPAARSEPELTVWKIIKLLMKKKSIGYALSTALGLALVAALLMHHSTASAWAIEQSIAALQKYKAIHVTGYTTVSGPPAPVELWARSDANGLRSDACLAKSDSFSAWVKDNRTYTYDHARKTVYVDPAITMGINPWFGPRFLTALSKMRDFKAVEGDDPATGQRRVLVTASVVGASGPESFYIEFDARTKLPVSIKRWANLDRRGFPDFVFEKIVYFEKLPDNVFEFEPPPDAQFVDKPLTVPEANLPLLADPTAGITVEGLSREDACRKLLQQLWAAVTKDDLERIHQLCPITATLPDGVLRDPGPEDDVVELLGIGDIIKEGQSKLGPLALIPSRVRCKDGKVREIKMVVQFRQTEHGASCVLNGNYGYSVEVD